MKVILAILSAIFLQSVRSSDPGHYEVPEPLFEVFSPKGLRILLADSRGIDSVEFFITVPSTHETLTYEARSPDGSYWTYWNPEVAVRLYETIQYKIMVRRQGYYWKREGAYVVKKVTSHGGQVEEADCTEDQGQKIISIFPNLENSERHDGSVSSGKSSNFQSSYSSYKSSDSKPITKSSTSTTSGTFYLKPSGIVEASGYKSESSFDSTKNQGEQWQHSRSDLTAEELESMKRLYESGFKNFPDLAGKFFPASFFEKYHLAAESKNFPGELRSIGYGDKSSTGHQFHQTHQTHESSSVSHSEPTRHALPLSSSGGYYKTFSEDRVEYSGAPKIESGSSQSYFSTSASTYPKVDKASHSLDYSSSHQEVVKPVYTTVNSGSSRSDHREFTAGNLKTVDSSHGYSNRYDSNSIFTSYTSSKPKSSQECSLSPNIHFTSTGDVYKLERFTHELSCLASVLENSMKEELTLLRQKNSDLIRRLEAVERETKRLESACNCY